MRISGNTILITGGTSGIGRALAEAFYAEGNQVIVTGRRQHLLDEIAAANPNMKTIALDVEDSAALDGFAQQLKIDRPELNVVIHNAGIMRSESVQNGSVVDAETTVTTNLLAPIRLTAVLLPLLLRQPQSAIITVSSGLAFVPTAMSPTYCATKAAIHSYTQSLRYQLRNTAVQVFEIIPPYVQTELTGAHQANDSNAMPLKDFITETMTILKTSPDTTEICVERVKPLRYAEVNGGYDALFQMLNDSPVAAKTTH